MFERYTEKARRVIFFARYEASQYGSPFIETEHLLLGLLREDKALANRFLRTHGSIESIRKEIESRITVRERISTSVEVPLSQECKRILTFAAEEAERLGHKHVGTEHLLLGVLREEKSFGAEILLERGLRLSTVREELARSTGEKVPVNRPKEASLLAEFSRDLTQAAMEGQLDPLVGRDRELERAIQILCRRTKNNPVLIGEPGVGKTAIVEGLAQRIADGDVPPFLADKRILSLDLSLIVAGTKYRGQFEERLKTIMKELMESQNAIVFIDELHTLVGAGSAEGSLDAANILKPALSRGEIQCIGATTPAEYRKSVEKDRSLERRFQSVKVPAPAEDEAIRVLQGVRDRYEKFHAVSYTEDAIRYAVYLSNRYIPDRFLPDKAIDLLDEAGSRVKLRQAMLPDEVSEVQKRVKFITHRMETAIANHEFEKARFYSEEERKEKEHLRMLREKLKIDDSSTGIVTREDIEDVVARWTGIQVSAIKEDEQQKLLRIEEELHRRVISQDKSITALARAIRRSRAGLKAPGRPVGCFLFLGPTGVGKTEVARRLAEFLFGSEKSLIRFDMSEYMEKHSVSKLIGAPPGYVGYEEGGQLTERVRRTPYSVMLLDEIEKAHPDVYNILLQVFEDGQLTDGLGNTVDFRNTIIIMTSNIGARQLQKQAGLGFQSADDLAIAKSQDDMVMGEVKRVFNPEFLNRLDEVILFNSLTDDDLLRIIDLLVGQINETLVHRQVQIALTPEARQWILEKTCSDRNYGARPLRRALQKYVEDPLSEALIQGGLQRPATLEIYLSTDGLFSDLLWKQPRWPTRNPTRASWTERSGGGAKYLGRGSAALTRTMAAGRKIFLRRFQFPVVVYLFCFSIVHPVWAQRSQPPPGPQYIIDRIEFQGNRRIQRDTLLARIFSRAGDPLTDEAIHRDFQALWNTQFFEDIRLEVEDDPQNPRGKILVYYVTERPIIRRIEYKGNKSVTESDILDRFKERKVGLSVESQFDPTKIKRAEVVLKELLSEHGRQFATVKPTYERIAATNAVKLVFNIDEGPKVKVGEIKFTGNKAFSERKLVRAMKHDRPYSIPLGFTEIPVLSKTYDRQKLDEDLEIGVRGLYQNNGYFKVLVKDPILKIIDEDRGGIPGPWPVVGSKHGKSTNITIPIEEGEQYRMGIVRFRTSDPEQGLVFKPEALTRVFPLKEGDIFSAEKVRKALDDYKKLYGGYGYINFVATPVTEVNDATKLVSITMEFDQGKPFYVRRIEFSGNTTTRDKVIRRQLLIDEGQVFDNRRWELSLLRLNQLNYFDPIKPENAELKKNEKNGTVDIKLKVHEKGKQSISFSGGVSGIAGTFVSLSYQTNNFLGLGETLTISGQLGNLQQGATFGFTEPYLFDRPISTGFTVFYSKFNYNQAKQEGLLLGQQVAIDPALQQNYTTDSHGFTIFASYPLRKYQFTRVGVTYGFSTTNITAFSQSAQLLFEFTQFRSLAGPSALSGIQSSKITPTISYSTVDNPQNPTRGKSFYYGLGWEGGPLGGNTNTFTNTFNMTYFRPHHHKRNVIGVRVMSSMITGYNGTDVPPYSRFYLGGENDVRGFDFYTISPFVAIPSSSTTTVTYFDPTRLGPGGAPTQVALNVPIVTFLPTRPGGDFQGVGNFEYRIPIAGPVSMSLFNDIGLDGIIRKSQLSLNPGALSTLQQQYPNADFPNLMIPKNLEVLSGTNFKPHTSAGVEFVIQLPIVNAPFRFYYAYNYLRLNQTISGPRGGFFLSDAQKSALPPGVFETQIAPQLDTILDSQVQRIPAGLIEPKQTFRFTISRTF